ncbi:hypothetical protein VTK73DRAFT_5411 [Phialemonium thermophilum]|uniref:FAD-binding oxidoreductase/transferase type 4 C-terminal domain-containing protein n=1 Tax=Phialemonium thermophilum TaxID=223376 RepID=A0ABR3V1X4_9PEZI
MVKRAVELEGTVTGEHGVGLVKRDYLPHELGESTVDLMRKIKQAFDPLCLLNCDKVVRMQKPKAGEGGGGEDDTAPEPTCAAVDCCRGHDSGHSPLVLGDGADGWDKNIVQRPPAETGGESNGIPVSTTLDLDTRLYGILRGWEGDGQQGEPAWCLDPY